MYQPGWSKWDWTAHGRVLPFDSKARCAGGSSLPASDKSGNRCCAISGCLCLLYGLIESSALIPNIPTMPLKTFACSKYKSTRSAVHFSTNSTALLIWTGSRFFGSNGALAIDGAMIWKRTVRLQSCKGRNRRPRHGEINRIMLNSDAGIPDRLRRRNRRPGAHEWIENDSSAEWERGADDLAHEGLGLQRRMCGDNSLVTARRRRPHNIGERLVIGYPAQAAGAPFSQVVLNAAFARFAEQTPRLPS